MHSLAGEMVVIVHEVMKTEADICGFVTDLKKIQGWVSKSTGETKQLVKRIVNGSRIISEGIKENFSAFGKHIKCHIKSLTLVILTNASLNVQSIAFT